MILKGAFHLSKNFHGQKRNRTEKKSFSAFAFNILCHVAGKNLLRSIQMEVEKVSFVPFLSWKKHWKAYNQPI